MANSRRPHRSAHHTHRPRMAPTGSTNRTRAESTTRPRSSPHRTHAGPMTHLRDSMNRAHRALMVSTDRRPGTTNHGRTIRAESTVHLRDSTSRGRALVPTAQARDSTSRTLARTVAKARRGRWTRLFSRAHKVTMVRRPGLRRSSRLRIRPLMHKRPPVPASGLNCRRHQRNSMRRRLWIPAYLPTPASQVVPARQPGQRRMNQGQQAVRTRTTRRERRVPSRPRTTQSVPSKTRAIARNPRVRHRYSIPPRSIRRGDRAAPHGLPTPATPPRADHLRAQHRPRVAMHRTTTANTVRHRERPTTIQPPRRHPARGQHQRRRASSIAPRPHYRHPATTSNDPHRHHTHPVASSTPPRPQHKLRAATSTDRHRHRRHRAASSASRRQLTELISKGLPAPESRNPIGRKVIAARRRPNGSPAPIPPVLSSKDRRRHRRHRTRSSDVQARDRRER